ncbi:MAG: hypothetical protein ACKO3P_07840, partial [Planctomycetaceae bacterium]
LNNQPPLYFAFTWCAARWIGFHESGLRLVSLLAGVALVPATWWLSRQLGVTTAGAMLAATLVAIDRHCIGMSLEVRPYACVQLLAALQVGLFCALVRSTAASPGPGSEPVRARSERPLAWAWLGFICASALLLYLHLLAGLIAIPETAWVLLLAIRTPTRQPVRALLPWVGAALTIGLLASPLVATFREVHAHRAMLASWMEPPTLLNWLSTAYALPLVVVSSLLGLGLRELNPAAKIARPDASEATSPPPGTLTGSAPVPPPQPATQASSSTSVNLTSPAADLTTDQPPTQEPWLPSHPVARRLRSASAFIRSTPNESRATAWFLLIWIFLPLLATWALSRWGVMKVTSTRYLVTMWIAPLLWVAERATRTTTGREFWFRVVASVVLILIPGLLRGFHYEPNEVWLKHPRLVALANSPELRKFPVLYATQLVEAQQLETDTRPQFREYLLSPITTLHPLSPGRILVPIPDRTWGVGGTTPHRAVALATGPIRAAGGCVWFGEPLAPAELAELWRHPGEPPIQVEVDRLADRLSRCRITQPAR